MDEYAHGLKLAAAGEHIRAIEAFERALALNPADTRVLFALGNTARTLGMTAAAEEFYRKVLALEPLRIEAIVNLANVLRVSGRFDEAEALIRPALAQSGDVSALTLTLGSIARERGDSEKAIRLYREVLATRPGDVAALVNLADLISNAGEDDEALLLYERALKADPGNAQARLNRAILYFMRGRLKEGWQDYAARLKIPGKVPVPDHGLKRWTGDSLKKTRLLVTAEQGVGDHLMFASLIPELAARAARDGGRVLLECEPRLRPLFARSFPDIDTHDWQVRLQGGVTRSSYGWLKAAGGANAAIELGSLPKLMRKTLESFPRPHRYLTPDPEECARWRAAFADLPRPWIGLAWRSGLSGGARSIQYAPLEAWGRFLKSLPGTPIVAQYSTSPEEIATLEAMGGRALVLPAVLDQKQELDRTAAMLSVLDGVVTAPTAVAWLAAGLGLPTYKVLYYESWTSFGQRYEPFGPSAEAILPQTPGDWDDGLAQILEKIRSKA